MDAFDESDCHVHMSSEQLDKNGRRRYHYSRPSQRPVYFARGLVLKIEKGQRDVGTKQQFLVDDVVGGGLLPF